MKKIFVFGIIASIFLGCKPQVAYVTVPYSGLADFSDYLAIGSSYTAGFTDSSLTVSGQINSFPQRLYEQFSLVPGRSGGKGYFIQPLLQSDNGYPYAKFIVGYHVSPCNNLDSSLTFIHYPNFIMNPNDVTPYSWQNSNYNNGQINNIGVPGIRVADFAVSGYANSYNAYAQRFYHLPTTSSPLAELKYRMNNLHPTFFTIWMGMDDILGYAVAGGVGNDGNSAMPTGSYYKPTDITPNQVFYNYYDSIIVAATNTSAGGALINIPSITELPFFTTIPSNGFTISRQSLADSLNNYWKSKPVPPFKAFQIGSNQFMVQDHNNNTRQSVPGELVLMNVPIDSINCYKWGSFAPIPNRYVITTDELQFINTSTNNFNNWIYQESLLYKLAWVDMHGYFSTLNTGIFFNGIDYSTNFMSGGAFSLDGIHPTQRGYAVIANRMLSVIDSYYHATVPMLDANKYNGVLFP